MADQATRPVEAFVLAMRASSRDRTSRIPVVEGNHTLLGQYMRLLHRLWEHAYIVQNQRAR